MFRPLAFIRTIKMSTTQFIKMMCTILSIRNLTKEWTRSHIEIMFLSASTTLIKCLLYGLPVFLFFCIQIFLSIFRTVEVCVTYKPHPSWWLKQETRCVHFSPIWTICHIHPKGWHGVCFELPLLQCCCIIIIVIIMIWYITIIYQTVASHQNECLVSSMTN